MDEVQLGSRVLQPRRQLLANGRREPLGKRALDILSVLAEAKGEIVTKDELLAAVWPGVIVEENALQVHVVALRKVLGPEAIRLKTIRGIGYRLDIDLRAEPDAASTSESVTPAATDARAKFYSRAKDRDAFAAVRTRLGVHRWPVITIFVALVLGGAWTLFGSELGLGTKERAPIVVRELSASGSGGQTEAALASGITDELIVRLRRIPELRVATAEAGGTVPGGSFRNAFIVDGSIRQSGDQLRVTVRLFDPSGEVRWSQSFDRSLADLFKVQEAVAATIADTLSVSLDVGTNATEHGGTDDPEAFAAYLLYRPHRLDPDQSAAVGYLERALALDPNYIKALSGLAASYASQAARAPTKQRALALLAGADEAAERAIAANPDLWIGYASRGWIYSVRKDFISALESFRRVAELDDGTDPELKSTLASYSLGLGRTREALSLLASNDLLDPIGRNDPTRIGALLQQGKEREAIDLFERLAAIDPSSARGPAAGNAFWAHLLSGGEARALVFADQHIPGLADRLRAFKAEKELPHMSTAQVRRWAQTRYGDGGNLDLAVTAAFAGYYGHTKLAIDLLRLSDERIGGFAHAVIWNPVMAGARKTDEFEQLVADLGLLAFWRESGQWPDFCRPISSSEISCR